MLVHHLSGCLFALHTTDTHLETRAHLTCSCVQQWIEQRKGRPLASWGSMSSNIYCSACTPRCIIIHCLDPWLHQQLLLLLHPYQQHVESWSPPYYYCHHKAGWFPLPLLLHGLLQVPFPLTMLLACCWRAQLVNVCFPEGWMGGRIGVMSLSATYGAPYAGVRVYHKL